LDDIQQAQPARCKRLFSGHQFSPACYDGTRGCCSEYRHPELVTPTKIEGCTQLTARGGIESDYAAPAVLGREASRVVRPGRGAIFLGRRQQREDQILPRNLAAGPPVCHRSRRYNDLQAKDRARTAAVPFERETHPELLTLEELRDRKPSQFLSLLRGLAPDVPEDFLYTIWSSRLPPNIQTILAGQQECSLDASARCADRISEMAL
jgi:hypothetical protein